MIEILPSLLVESKQEFERLLRLVEHDAPVIHIDILDGSMFGQTNWHDARAVGAMVTPAKYELHLMTTNPLPIVEEWKREVPGVIRAIIHAEIERPIGTLLETIKDVHKLEAGLALNPESPLDEEHELLHQIHLLLLMSVHPGKSGQAFEGDYMLEKIRLARNHVPNLPIEVDGGVTLALAPALVKAGATLLCAASAIFSAPDPAAALRALREIATSVDEKGTPPAGGQASSQ